MIGRRISSSVLLASAVVLAVVSTVAGGAASASRVAGVRVAAGFTAVVALEEAGQVAVLRGPSWRVVREGECPRGAAQRVSELGRRAHRRDQSARRASTLIRAQTGAVIRPSASRGIPTTWRSV